MLLPYIHQPGMTKIMIVHNNNRASHNSFPFSPSLFTSKLKIEILRRMCIYEIKTVDLIWYSFSHVLIRTKYIPHMKYKLCDFGDCAINSCIHIQIPALCNVRKNDKVHTNHVKFSFLLT